MKNKILNKNNLNGFIVALAKEQKVLAPVSKGYKSFVFEEVTDAKNISLKYIPTILPPKKYFMPQYETLVEYDITSEKARAVVESCAMVIFGVHTCDLAGIQCLNMVFAEKPKDANYLIKKSKAAIIGIECNEYCDEYASCTMMGNHLPDGGYDLFFTDLGDYFIVAIHTQLGDDLVTKTGLFTDVQPEHLKALKELREKKKKIFKNEVGLDKKEIENLFDKSFKSKVWDDLDNRCLACGNCTNVCPTCYCFDVVDEPNFDLKTGRRYRAWDSCQNEPFAKVAGGESFREKRGWRQRHRYYRKFKYPLTKYSKFFCTGCGRCSRTCMAQINLKETLSFLKEENK
ncbi:Ni/Fe hydrogenase subunit beta [candidate division WOR-1 bacterium RIFOXYA2_FULL_36_21]|uniref:Ni/Fe hydrogenase subunit beta n=1 Tax=candidate division WOR-1 bacterium RIFOXYB2_FULL_36_35 TaxID=1802578 RepID=A0A1F4SAE3_UNCSA|nr:MAG: Ni/Fe hydrogenase subunit beta [candidate division WOR-1 bacterium RIFOXYA2_FULL_36_21]OGC15998.1 MAG: Ni/Fe hydrogenase subunit beta [candidate division WOR-1 bacterium RIFOXYA12_FULL_36_13]OGC16713.1 MAG: Ni/Fe hydrogenase subunit beta [candidate division WOR-1 bacterium RIFOXYB2_FULL_36_35]